MISKTFLVKELRKLNGLYSSSSSSDVDMQLRFSRLAVLEVGAWSESCMDNIIESYIKRKKLKSRANSDYISDKIKRTYGFSYDPDFRRLLINSIGIASLDKLENSIDQGKFLSLKSALGTMKTERDSHAHKTIGALTVSMAPSVCLRNFDAIYDGLKEIDVYLRR